MSIGRRLFNLARSELNDLLERAAKVDDDDEEGGADDDAREEERASRGAEERDGRPSGRRRRPSGEAVDLSSLSDAELSAEIERRRRQREAEARGQKSGGSTSGDARGTQAHEAGGARSSSHGGSAHAGARGGHAGGPGSSRGAAPPPPNRAQIAKAYASLEVPPGSDFETVRRAYRTLMRKYHPDRHAQSADKQRAATELAQKLTESYKLLERQLRR